MSDATRWRVSIERPDGITYACDVRRPSIMEAIGFALHEFSSKHPEIALNTLFGARVTLIERGEIEGAT